MKLHAFIHIHLDLSVVTTDTFAGQVHTVANTRDSENWMIVNPQNETSSSSSSSAAFASTISHFGGIVSHELYFYTQTIVDLWTVLIISLVGVVTNILNIIVFAKQGFQDGVNISLTSITIWDLVKCLGSVIHRMYGPIRIVCPAAGLSWRNMTFPSITYLPLFAGYVAYALTTYVGVERCLSVTAPLKVKSLFTTRFTLILDTLISVFVFAAFSVMFFVYRVDYVYDPSFNTTIAVYSYNSFYYANENTVMIYYKCVGLLVPVLSFLVLCVTSAITVVHLKKHSALLWRTKDAKLGAKNSTRSGKNISLRQKRAIRTILVVIAICMVNILPRIPIYIATLIDPDFYILKKYNNLFLLLIYLIYILDFSNASCSFFVFLKLSTNFRKKFQAIFNKNFWPSFQTVFGFLNLSPNYRQRFQTICTFCRSAVPQLLETQGTAKR